MSKVPNFCLQTYKNTIKEVLAFINSYQGLTMIELINTLERAIKILEEDEKKC